MSIDIRREAEELVRYYTELVRRLPQNGVRSIAELLALHEQLRRAAAAIQRQEINWATEQTERLVEALIRMDANLQALRRLKAWFEHVPAEEARLKRPDGTRPR
jgi:hypothetical protein